MLEILFIAVKILSLEKKEERNIFTTVMLRPWGNRAKKGYQFICCPISVRSYKILLRFYCNPLKLQILHLIWIVRSQFWYLWFTPWWVKFELFFISISCLIWKRILSLSNWSIFYLSQMAKNQKNKATAHRLGLLKVYFVMPVVLL